MDASLPVRGSTEFSPELAEVLARVKSSTGVDLGDYRPAGIARRAFNRAKLTGCDGFSDYLALLSRDQDEARRFLEYVVIKWSRFFRDQPFFDKLRDAIVPAILTWTGGEIAAWSAGCGRGEEAYSLAIMLDEALPPSHPRGTVVATDIDETALSAAQDRIYTQVSVEGVSEDQLAAHFSPALGRSVKSYLLSGRFASAVRFRRHNLLCGSLPTDRQFHLVLCRNVLIYFRRPSQATALRLLSSAVMPGGFLCLGEAEQLPAAYSRDYETVDRKLRIYRKRQVA